MVTFGYILYYKADGEYFKGGRSSGDSKIGEIQKEVYDNEEDAKKEGTRWVRESQLGCDYEIEKITLRLNNSYQLYGDLESEGIVEI